jgi:flavin reductase (DIM6/NTAB) family NADH-FMN oxidoreductase RutF
MAQWYKRVRIESGDTNVNYSKKDIQNLEKRFRASFVNSLSGFKSLNLIGTINDAGLENVAIFNSVIHLGADPALLGMICRPDSVARHTLENIRVTNFYTINGVSENIFENAHHTSARFNESEFSACQLTPLYKESFKAPFIKESPLQIGMKFIREVPIDENGTTLIIGSIESVEFNNKVCDESGYIDLEKLNLLSGVSLEGYYKPTLIARLDYAKPDKPTRRKE